MGHKSSLPPLGSGTPRRSGSVRPHGLTGVAGLALAAAGASAFVHTRVRKAAKLHPARGRFAAGLHYVEAGFGPSVVLLHGLGAMLEDFQLAGVFALAAKQFRVLAFDRPGYGHGEVSAARPRAPLRLLLPNGAPGRFAAAGVLEGAHAHGSLPAPKTATSRAGCTPGACLNEDLRFSTSLEIPEVGYTVHHASPDAVMRAIQATAA